MSLIYVVPRGCVCELLIGRSLRCVSTRLSDHKETVHRNAHALLKDTKVTARIEQIRAGLRETRAITLDHLVEALRPIAFSDIRKVVTWGPAIPLKDPRNRRGAGRPGCHCEARRGDRRRGRGDDPSNVSGAIPSLNQPAAPRSTRHA